MDRARSEAGQKRLHAVAIMVEAQQVLSALQAADSAQRGFLLTGDGAFLDSYREGVDQSQERLRRLRDLAHGDLTQRVNVDELSRLVARRTDSLERILTLHRQGRHTEAQTVVAAYQGRRTLLRAGEVIARVTAEEDRFLRDSAAAALVAERRAQGDLYGLLALVLLVLLGSARLHVLAERARHRARAAEAVQARDDRLAAVVDGAGLGIWHWDMATETFTFGRHWCAMLGIREDEVVPTTAAWAALVHPDDWPRLDAALRDHLEGRTPVYRSEHRLRHRDGHWVCVLDSGRVTGRDAQGRPLVMTGTHLDITSRKEAEEALRASEEINRRILAASPDCIKLLTLDGRVEHISGGGLRAMEFDDGDRQALGLDWVGMWPPEDRPRVREAMAVALSGGTSAVATGRFQAYCPTQRGTPKWWDSTVTAVAGPDGAPERLMVVSRDITRQRGVEDRLALLALAAEQLLTSRDPGEMVAGAYKLIAGPLGLGAFIYCHRADGGDLGIAAWAGFPHQSVAAIRPDALQHGVCGQVARNRAPAQVEGVQASDDPAHAFLRAEGLTAFVSVPLLVGDDVLGTLGFGRRSGRAFGTDDIAFLHTLCHYVAIAVDRMRAEDRLRRFNAALEERVAERTGALEQAALDLGAEMRRREDAQAQLLQAQKMEALGRLVGGVAHDFNNILAAVQGAFAILERRVDDPKLGFVIGQGRKAGDRAGALVRGMLAFARQKPLEARVMDPAAMLADLDGMIRHALGARVDCVIEAAPGTWPVLVDPNQFEVALLNLAINARDAMPEGGRLRVTLRNMDASEPRPATLGPGGHVVIEVADTGCGMDEAQAARIFEPFFTTKAPGRGTGLGLAQVHGFAVGAGGTVSVDSAPGRGTTMRIVLPRSDATVAERSSTPSGESPLHGRATVLVVDDDDQVRPVTATLLRDLGYEVIEAAGGEVAQDLPQVGGVDLLLTDVTMPGIDGPELVRRLRVQRPDLPVLFMTGYAGSHALEGEMVVAKPFSGPELGTQVLRALGRAAA